MPPNIVQDFSSDSRRIKGRISRYATLDATQKPEQKTKEMGPLFISTALTLRLYILLYSLGMVR